MADGAYRAWRAEETAARRSRRPKVSKLVEHPRLRGEAERRLLEHWSPQQIAARLVCDYPDDPEMRVSHETIYRSLFVQARGALRKELTTCLRTGGTQRCSHKRTELSGIGRLRGMIMISNRPAQASDRAIPGHWEGDLILGKRGRSAVRTLVDRSSLYVVLLHLPNGRTAESVRVALTHQLSKMPADLRRTLTWDQGKEMAEQRAVYYRHQHRRLLLRPAQPLAARQQREHQRLAPPVPTEERRPEHLYPPTSSQPHGNS